MLNGKSLEPIFTTENSNIKKSDSQPVIKTGGVKKKKKGCGCGKKKKK